MKKGQIFTLDDGKRYHSTADAARVVGITSATMWRWAAANVTSFGLELGVVRRPATKWKHAGGPKKPRDFRLLVPEERVLLMKRLLHDFPLNGGGHLSEYDMDNLKLAANLYRSSQAISGPQP